MTTSACATRLATSTCWRCSQPGGIGRGVAADADGRLAFFIGLVGHLDELGAQRLDLLLDGGPDVEASITAPSRLAVAIACRPATPTPSTTTRAALIGAGGGHQHREQALVVEGAQHHGLVAGDVGLRRQHVHALRAGGARGGLQREGGEAGPRPDAPGRPGSNGFSMPTSTVPGLISGSSPVVGAAHLEHQVGAEGARQRRRSRRRRPA